VVTTVGYQFISPGGCYPLSQHPEPYHFTPPACRTLNEYQLIYITSGSGYFESDSTKNQKIHGGTLMILFPGESHSYHPDSETGWNEYWVGFRGLQVDRLIRNRFFTKERSIVLMGYNAELVRLYESIIYVSKSEKAGYQAHISGIVMHILGFIHYIYRSSGHSVIEMRDRISAACCYMRYPVTEAFTQESIASRLGISYSSYRQSFKRYVGISPMRYQNLERLRYAKELLKSSSSTIYEISESLHFENASEFSAFFRRMTGESPSGYRGREREQN
jgi:AraC-like DNA-binding protein